MSAYQSLSHEDKHELSQWVQTRVLGVYYHHIGSAQHAQLHKHLNFCIQRYAGDAVYEKVFERIKNFHTDKDREKTILIAISALMDELLLRHIEQHPLTSVMQALLFYEREVRLFFTRISQSSSVQVSACLPGATTHLPRGKEIASNLVAQAQCQSHQLARREGT